MRWFLGVEYLLCPLHLLQIVLSIINSGDNNLSLFSHTFINIGARFIHIAGLRYGGRQWYYYSMVHVSQVMYSLLALSSVDDIAGVTHLYSLTTVLPFLLNTLAMLWRKPHWETLCSD